MTSGCVHAEFVNAGGRRVFTLLRTPDMAGGECTLVVPPFTEEMNKSRRLVTDFVQHARRDGRAVLCVDLSGTGDSDGEFADARVGQWMVDLAAAVAWSAGRGWRVTSILGIRFGAILAAALLRQGGFPCSRAVFWQPVISGTRLIDQFLRIRVLAARMEHDRNETVAELRARLKEGATVEVAGYQLSGALCADVDALALHDQWTASFPPVTWLEVVADTAAPVNPGTQRAIEAARAAGCRVDYTQVAGEPFWMSTEIVTNPALVSAS